MLLYQDALARLLAAAQDRGLRPHQTIPLEDAIGRTASSNILAGEALPPFDNSAMDGFAVASERTAGASADKPARLPVSAVLAAGDVPSCAAHPGAVEIMTGAPLPPGTDAVVRVEDTERADADVLLKEPASAGDFVRRRGADFSPGDVVVEAGEVIAPRHVLALAALGHARVPVRLRPRVAIISTGKELVPYDKKPGPGQIRNATAAFLVADLLGRGAQLVARHEVGDDPAAFRARVEEQVEQETDLVLATGGVSMGRYDFVPEVIAELGAETLFHKTAVRPGKPVLAASLGNGPLFLGLPGNPISTAMAARFFVDPVMRFQLGRPQERPLRRRLAEDVEKPEGLRCFFKGAADDKEARCLKGQASFQIKPLVQADCWVVLPEAGEIVKAGAEVEVFPL